MNKTKSDSDTAESHRNEGFLKAAWHKLTGDPDHYQSSTTKGDETKGKETKDENEGEGEQKKKAAGSGGA